MERNGMDGLGLNVMLVVVVLAAVFKIVDGYKKGVVREVISLISMASTAITTVKCFMWYWQ